MSNPRNDGIDHINVYSKGKTELDRMLTNFAYIPFEYKGIKYASVEAWWYCYLLGDNALGSEKEELVKLFRSYKFFSF